MHKNSNGETFIGFSGLVGLAAILCLPALGFGGLLAAAATIYFGLVLTNGADTAAKRRSKRQ